MAISWKEACLQNWDEERLRIELLDDASLIRMADSKEQLIPPVQLPVHTLDIIFNDSEDLDPPTEIHAKQIFDFVTGCVTSNIVFQCQFGIGRSMGCLAAFIRLRGLDDTPILKLGTYNRRLYKLLLKEGGMEPDPEPLVSMVVRLKYPSDYFELFHRCMRRQRYTNWEIVAVSDGKIYLNDLRQSGDGWRVSRVSNEVFDTEKVRLIETSKKQGHWGHPYRQLGIDAAKGEWIGLSNDDNYYCPGYLEQMVFKAQREGADFVSCPMLHAYHGWGMIQASQDLGCWLARRELISRVEWPGNHARADRDHIKSLMRNAKKIAVLDRALFVKN